MSDARNRYRPPRCRHEVNRFDIEGARDGIEHQHARITAACFDLRQIPFGGLRLRGEYPARHAALGPLGSQPGADVAKERGIIRPRRFGDGRVHQLSIFTYSKSPGLLSMPTLGAEIHGANLAGSVSDFIRLAMKSPSSVDGSHSPLRFAQVASSISTPSGVACTSLNSPICRWNATFGSVSL